MKKCMLIGLITVFTLVTAGALCFADSRRGVANTSKKGSLLIFPLVKVSASTGDAIDTIITISNDYSTKVHVNCRYQTANNCACDPFSFDLTGYHPISFRAETGEAIEGGDIPGGRNNWIASIDPFPTAGNVYVGELRCWATDSSNMPISFNWLSGTATILEGVNQSWEYSAWRFQVGYAVNNRALVPNVLDGSSVKLRMTGMPTTYDACPRQVMFNFIEQTTSPDAGQYDPTNNAKAENRLTLVPCKQDCVTGGTPVHLSMAVFNEYEENDEAWACLNCTDNVTAFYSKSLSDSTKFDAASRGAFSNLGTPGGMGIVSNNPESSTCSEVYGVPVLGVISNKLYGVNGPVAGETLTVIGRGQPYLADANGDTTIEVGMSYQNPNP